MANHVKLFYTILLFTITGSASSQPMSAASSDTSGPHFTSIEGPRVIMAGVRTDFTCSADCKPDCTYTWQVSGREVEGEAVTLTVDGHRDSIELECTATNPVSKDTQSTSKTVEINNPVMVVPSTSSIPVEGKPFSMICNGSGPGITTTWLKGHEPFPADPRMQFSENNRTLTFSSLLPSDVGFYTCVVTNSTMKVASRGYLLDFGTISVDIQGPHTVMAGVEQNFTCVPDCSMDCSTLWTFQQFPQGNFKARGTTITWTPARPGLVQNFTCVAENKLAQRMIQVTLRVVVTVPPTPSGSVIERPSIFLLFLVSLQLLFALSA
ncbi:carcinoembryonic antigen-related cell adhesion molecule 5-like isoform X2 [Engraulis encrasicolus]|uniref:carcinoembryonic antigen-related cell adhesion molecule 5-like isoform X2 n=1 Tax=Engraulis encrasicolus TaxID=184585 RepID=UPI002FD37216